MNILICKDYKEFEKKLKQLSVEERQLTNGVSEKFLKENYYDIDMYTHICEDSKLQGCWDCIDCDMCTKCEECLDCLECKNGNQWEHISNRERKVNH